MSIYFVPALIALVFKFLVLAYALRGGKVSLLFLSLIIVFAAHNAIEVLGYFNVQSEVAVNIFFRLYYVATAYLVLYILLHGLSVSKLENTVSTSILVILCTSLSSLMLFTDTVIAGQYSIGYTLTAVKGSLYWLFSAYLLIALLSNFAVLFYGRRSAKSQLGSVRCSHSLVALAPIMLVLLIALIFKITDIGINATGLAPIATALFLAIILKTESKHKLSDLRRLMPLSAERETSNSFMDLLDNYIQRDDRSNVYKELQAGIEKEIIMYSIKKCDGNISKTTKMMGLKNRSTLYSMMTRLEMNLKEVKQPSTD
ncbi:MAG: DNA-binding protein Fis [Arenicella sp.]|jgi:DNA-binding protein Fis